MNIAATLFTRWGRGAEQGHRFARIVRQLLIAEARRRNLNVTCCDDRAGDFQRHDAISETSGRPNFDGASGKVAFQFKYVPSQTVGLSASDKQQIKEALERIATDQSIDLWILVTPEDFNVHQQNWFLALKDELNIKFGLKHWCHTEILASALAHPTVGNQVFPEIQPERSRHQYAVHTSVLFPFFLNDEQDVRDALNALLQHSAKKIHIPGTEAVERYLTGRTWLADVVSPYDPHSRPPEYERAVTFLSCCYAAYRDYNPVLHDVRDTVRLLVNLEHAAKLNAELVAALPVSWILWRFSLLSVDEPEVHYVLGLLRMFEEYDFPCASFAQTTRDDLVERLSVNLGHDSFAKLSAQNFSHGQIAFLQNVEITTLVERYLGALKTLLDSFTKDLKGLSVINAIPLKPKLLGGTSDIKQPLFGATYIPSVKWIRSLIPCSAEDFSKWHFAFDVPGSTKRLHEDRNL